MKVRILTVTALAVALGTQATAQQGELERSLADLNSGVIAPSMGGASASGSTGLDISGDAIVRSSDWGTGNNWVDTRVRVNMDFAVSEASSAFVQLSATDTWNAGLGNANGFGTSIAQAYFTNHNLLGTGGDWKVGRSYATVGSGRILGTDDWDMNATNTPTTFSGWSYGNNFGGVDLGLAWINNDIAAIGGADDGWWAISASFDMGNDMINGVDFDYITQEDGANTWWEATTGGAVSMFNWGVSLGNYDDGTNSFSANAMNVALNASDWTGGFVGNLGFEMTDSDAGFAVISAADHGSLGIADALGAGTGAWGGDVESTTISADLNIMDGWNTGFAMVSTTEAAGDGDEMDLTVGRSFGGGVDGWFGYGDGTTADGADFTVYYVQLSLAF